MRIRCRGTEILIWDPEDPEAPEKIWKWTRVNEYGSRTVPKGYKVRVLDGWVTMSTAA